MDFIDGSRLRQRCRCIGLGAFATSYQASSAELLKEEAERVILFCGFALQKMVNLGRRADGHHGEKTVEGVYVGL